jgi:hypothetical protein
MDKKQTFFLTKSTIKYTSLLTLSGDSAGRDAMKVAILLGVLMADMFIGFYQLGGLRLGGAAAAPSARPGQVRAMDDVWPPPPPPPSYP